MGRPASSIPKVTVMKNNLMRLNTAAYKLLNAAYVDVQKVDGGIKVKPADPEWARHRVSTYVIAGGRQDYGLIEGEVLNGQADEDGSVVFVKNVGDTQGGIVPNEQS